MKLPQPFLKIKNQAQDQLETAQNESVKKLAEGTLSVQDVIAPPSLEVDFDHIQIGSAYFRTLFVVGYPRYVEANWLSPLIEFDHTLEISMFIYPVEAKGVLDELKRKIAEMEATIATDIAAGRVLDPAVKVALEDAQALQDQLVKGAEKFFQLGLYITIPAESKEELDRITKQVESTAGSLLIVTKHTTLQHEDGLKTTLPTGRDLLTITRNMDTTSLATTFPFTSSELTQNQGIMYGINEHNGSLIIFDRFSLENANECVFGTSGAGKSLGFDEEVIYQTSDDKVGKEKIGIIIERLIEKHGSQQIDGETEGVILPNLKVYTFDHKLKGSWANVTVAARKKGPKLLYKFTTASGREITTTGDHNLVVLKSGKIFAEKSSLARVGDYLPVPRKINRVNATTKLSFELAQLLGYLISEGLVNEKYTRIFNQDEEVLAHLKKLLRNLEFDYSKLRRNGKMIGISFKGKTKVFLRKLAGIGNSSEKRVPSFLFGASNKKVAKFLQTYFEGDGGIEKHSVNTVTKSYQLASDLAYLLFRFGILARITTKNKRATNTNHKGDIYYQLTISGQDNLDKFSQNIGFVTKEKTQKLKAICNKKSNTNVDIVPELTPIVNEIYNVLYKSSETPTPKTLNELRYGNFSPSRKLLKRLVKEFEKRILEIEGYPKNGFQKIAQLPNLPNLINDITNNKERDRQAWQTLGWSWGLMRGKAVAPGAVNTLRLLKTTAGVDLELSELKQEVYRGFQILGESLMKFDKALWNTVTQDLEGNTAYERLTVARDFLQQEFEDKQKQLVKVKEKLRFLKSLADSDLFWDPIVKIKKIKNPKTYVYDLMCDNQVFVAGFGGLFVHNSYLIKLEALRQLMFGSEIIVIDPEEEYKNLTAAIGGEYISFSFKSDSRINPFDLAGVFTEGENELGLKILSLHGLFKVIFGGMTATEDALLDRALILTYKAKGITPDPATQNREPPLLEDLYKVLIGMEEAEAKNLADKLEKFIKGSLAGLFNQPSNVEINNTFTVFGIRDLEDELRPVAMYIILDYIWTKIKRNLKKRLLIVDEAWYLMKYPDSAIFLYSIVKRARKYYLGLTTVTQDIEDFLSSDYGKAIVHNSAIQVLMKQSASAIDLISQVFYLSEGEKHLLLAADIGEGLFFAGPNHVAVRVVASPDEHILVTSKPEELLEIKQKAALKNPK